MVLNLRLRFQKLDFVERFAGLAEYPATTLPDGRTEIHVGDLVSDEQRIVVFLLQVLPIPLLAPGQPAATLEGEALLEVEVAYDEVSEVGLTSNLERHTIRVRPTQDPADIQVNETVLPWVTAQQAAGVLEKALARRDTGDVAGARKILADGIARLEAYGRDQQTADALGLLVRAHDGLADEASYLRERKNIQYSMSATRRMRSSEHWVGDGPAPSFIKQPPCTPTLRPKLK